MLLNAVERIDDFLQLGGDGLDPLVHRFEDSSFLSPAEGYDGVPRILPLLNLLKTPVNLVHGGLDIQFLELFRFPLAVEFVSMLFLGNHHCQTLRLSNT